MKNSMIHRSLVLIGSLFAAACSNEDAGSNPDRYQTMIHGEELMVSVDGELIAVFTLEPDHLKFAITGRQTPFDRAVVRGSIDDEKLLYLEWKKLGVSTSEMWDWSNDKAVESYSLGWGAMDPPQFPETLVRKSTKRAN